MALTGPSGTCRATQGGSSDGVGLRETDELGGGDVVTVGELASCADGWETQLARGIAPIVKQSTTTGSPGQAGVPESI